MINTLSDDDRRVLDGLTRRTYMDLDKNAVFAHAPTFVVVGAAVQVLALVLSTFGDADREKLVEYILSALPVVVHEMSNSVQSGTVH